jgi:two-component system sensor histidine kinase MtrB
MTLGDDVRAVGAASARLLRPVKWVWQSSLAFRVVATTLVLSIGVVALVGVLIMGRITSGLLNAKERSSLGEAASGLSQAQQLLTTPNTGNGGPKPGQLISTLIPQLASRAGSPSLYEIVLLASPGSGGDLSGRATNQVLDSSIPVALRTAVQRDDQQSWTYAQINYLHGPSAPGLVVGAPVTISSVGSYELYYLFPLTGEQDTLDLVQRTVVGAGLLLVLMLALIAYVVTRQVASPVRQAARTAERLSAGHLNERMEVRGHDDLARLAGSFNDMAVSLQDQIGRLESLSRVQQRFVSDVSHELRTPLTTVRMAADVLYESREDFDASTSRSAELLQTQLDRFEALLSDLLEISRFDAGAAVLDVEQVDLNNLVSRATESAVPLADRHGNRLQLELLPDPVLVECDPRRIDRVMRNLIANAIEHGEGREITIRVAADTDSVAIGVRDYGVGLKPGESSLVFSRFWRADPARARTIGGTGLGLSISLEDALLHGGWLEAWGAPGAGAHFRLTLPRDAGASLVDSPIPLEPSDAVALAARRVLPHLRGRVDPATRTGAAAVISASSGSPETGPDENTADKNAQVSS